MRIVVEVREQHETEWAAMRAVSELLGIGTTETVRKWVRRAEIDAGSRPGVSSEESAELKRLKRENAELKRANAILKSASLSLRQCHPDEVRWGSLVSSLPQFWLVAFPAMCGPAGPALSSDVA
ncbi:hypothetical protein BST30_06040 [Mycobacterium mantenii]|uniref:Transposase n=1 Tax=Mycobacterium mantenii TaxID=560555 RepID=A0A1X0G181_MYCNT|nr:hypothetical protein BST30_06040 [Mycobacterium mantenii]